MVISLHNGVWEKGIVSWPLVYWFTVFSTICLCKYITYAGQPARKICVGVLWSVKMSFYTILCCIPFTRWVDGMKVKVHNSTNSINSSFHTELDEFGIIFKFSQSSSLIAFTRDAWEWTNLSTDDRINSRVNKRDKRNLFSVLNSSILAYKVT